MKLRSSPLILLLLPAIASALVPHAVDSTEDTPAAVAPAAAGSSTAAASETADAAGAPGVKRHGVPTKDAPVDGKDGKPHLGPFVETDGVVSTGSDSDKDAKELPALKGRPDDPTIVDGKKIPETNDGVMFDKNRDHAQEGTTGLQGGVSEKERQRKAQEGRTGEKVVTRPEAPKEQPPLPHSEEQKIKGKSKSKDTTTPEKEDTTDFTGLDKPEDLPDRPSVKKPSSGSDSSTKKPADIPPPKTPPASNKVPPQHEEEGIIQPFHSFVLSLTMILFSEIGDKTFLVAALMAMKHDRMVVFSAAFGALFVMTILSAVLGHAVPTLLPKRLTSFLAAGLFFVFGAKLLKEGMAMDPNEGVSAEMHEVEQDIAEKEKELGRKRGNSSVSAYALEAGLGNRGSRSKGRFPSPPRSPSESPVRSPNSSSAVASIVQGATNLCSLLLSPAWVQTFAMTFLGEWGDRSQIATIAMAAGQDYWWVTLGATVGHAICTGVAVIGGRAIAGKVSLKVVTVGGAAAFLIFGFIYLLEALYA